MHSVLATGDGSPNLLTAFAQEPSQVYLQGLTPACGAYLLASLFRQLGRPFLLVTPNGEGHETFLKDLAFFLGDPADQAGGARRLFLFPGHEVLPFRELSFDSEVSCARMASAYVALTAVSPFLMVAPALALRQKLPPAQRLRDLLAYVLPGETLSRPEFLQSLLDGGYARRPVVEEKGEFSVRGGIIDLFPPLYEQPVRLEFWGDEVESIRRFDPASQRSLGQLPELLVLPPARWCWTERPGNTPWPGANAARTPSSGKTSGKAATFPASSAIWRNFTRSPRPCGRCCRRRPWWWSGIPLTWSGS